MWLLCVPMYKHLMLLPICFSQRKTRVFLEFCRNQAALDPIHEENDKKPGGEIAFMDQIVTSHFPTIHKNGRYRYIHYLCIVLFP